MTNRSSEQHSSRAMDWLSRQVQEHAHAAKPIRSVWNPKPYGVMIEGSTTHRVYLLLLAHKGRSFRHADLIRLTGSTSNALIWACRWLVFHGFATRRLDTMARRERYRYEWRDRG